MYLILTSFIPMTPTTQNIQAITPGKFYPLALLHESQGPRNDFLTRGADKQNKSQNKTHTQNHHFSSSKRVLLVSGQIEGGGGLPRACWKSSYFNNLSIEYQK